MYHRQTQFELFPGAAARAENRDRPRLFNSPLTFSMENFIVLTVVIVLSMVLSFSFGVERGKKDEVQAMPASSVKKAPPAALAVSVPSPLKSAGPEGAPAMAATENASTAVLPAEGPAAVTAAVPETTAQAENKPSEKVVDNFYTVQVASYKKGDYAQKEATVLKQKGYETLVVTKGEHEIVCVGKFAVMNEAKKFSQKLKKQYKDCLVRRM